MIMVLLLIIYTVSVLSVNVHCLSFMVSGRVLIIMMVRCLFTVAHKWLVLMR